MKKNLLTQAIILVSCIAVLAASSPFLASKESVSANATEQNKGVVLLGGENRCVINGTTIELKGKSYTRDGHCFLSVDDVLGAMGYSMNWNPSLGAISCTKDGVVTYIFPQLNNLWVGPTEYVFDHKPLLVSGRTYISEAMFTAITGETVTAEGELSEYMKITVLPGQLQFMVDEKVYPMTQKAFLRDGQPYLPLEDVLPALGFTLGWDAATGGITCTKDGVVSYIYPYLNNIWVGPTEYVFDYKPVILHNKTYVSAEVIKKLSGSSTGVAGELSELKNGDSIMQSQRTDAYRLPGNNVVSGGGVTVVDGFGMEFPGIAKDKAEDYAKVISAVGESLDSNINVYSMVVPTAAEFYAPERMYPYQLAGIQMVYSNLSDRITPVNVYDTLAEHAGEKIYFKTDHHWTQRGAYYAYCEFMDYKCVQVPEMSTFQNVPADNFVGSFASFARGTAAGNIMRNSPELLERYLPKYVSEGKVYNNPSMTAPVTTVKAVNTNWTSYSAFINGDNPITVFDTNAPGNKTIVIIKESYGNAFATWAMNDYKRVCVIDPRKFNGFDGYNTPFNLNQFCRKVGATDVLFINYPIVISSAPIKNAILKMK